MCQDVQNRPHHSAWLLLSSHIIRVIFTLYFSDFQHTLLSQSSADSQNSLCFFYICTWISNKKGNSYRSCSLSLSLKKWSKWTHLQCLCTPATVSMMKHSPSFKQKAISWLSWHGLKNSECMVEVVGATAFERDTGGQKEINQD